MKKPLISFSTMNDFACLGDRCEDSCCRSWDISFDKKHYNLLKTHTIDLGQDPTLIETHFSLSKTNDEKNFAQVIFDENDACPFLDESGLCDIHAEHGVDILSDVCTFFPRVFVHFEDRREMSGSLSCPELARKVLLTDASFDLTEISLDSLPREYDFPVSNEMYSDDDDIYSKKFFQVREALFTIMSNESVSFETRLYSLSSLANVISPYYYSGCNGFQIGQLESDLKTYSSRLKLMHTKILLDQYVPQDPMVIIVVQAVLRLRVQRFPNEKFSQLIESSFNHYENKMQDIPVLPDGNFPPESLMLLYQQEAKALNDKFPEIMDRVFSRYVQNSIFREMYTSMPNLFTYVHMLSIRVAMLKFLVASHPDIIALLQSEEGKETQKKLLEEKIIEVFYQFSRSIDHNNSFLEIVYFAVAEQQMMHYDFSLPFIKLQASA